MLTEEFVRIPPHVLGFISLRTRYKFRGLINVSGFHVDPGFEGHLIYAVYNAGPSAVHLERGEELFLIWFADLDKSDPEFTRHEPPVYNISPRLITDVSGEILTLQSLSRKMGDLEKRLFRFEVTGGAIVFVIGLLFTIFKFWDAVSQFLTLTPRAH